MMDIMKRHCAQLLLAVSTLVLAGSAVGGSTTAAPGSDEDAIRGVLANFVEAWNKHDAKAFSMAFAEDADFTNVVGRTARGRKEVEAFHAPRFATQFKKSNQKIVGSTIRLIKPDVAAVDARWEMTGAMGSDGQDIPLRKGLLSFVMTKDGNTWLITVMHNMNLID
jgi:uncharacterized protein (TIGR02246 family)